MFEKIEYEKLNDILEECLEIIFENLPNDTKNILLNNMCVEASYFNDYFNYSFSVIPYGKEYFCKFGLYGKYKNEEKQIFALSIENKPEFDLLFLRKMRMKMIASIIQELSGLESNEYRKNITEIKLYMTDNPKNYTLEEVVELYTQISIP